ncbi:MAG: hypothetical protein JRH18_19925 [Deltaproteobacteria bacterium]|nr:hypothetical protein [Deltaproteobacteria bacterium]MBW1962113.1 hypothetical protein [Deltaproteobacteria bacterium]MBW2153920.1 hypothetical protein [Deltaproteobacteria bacterium]
MTTVKEIEKVVSSFPPKDLAEFRAWFEKFDAEVRDRQFEEDVKKRLPKAPVLEFTNMNKGKICPSRFFIEKRRISFKGSCNGALICGTQLFLSLFRYYHLLFRGNKSSILALRNIEIGK